MPKKTPAVQRAIETGYVERRPGKAFDASFECYWQYYMKTKRPFVRVERRRKFCHVEADLFPTNQQFTDELHQCAVALFQPAAQNPTPSDYRFGLLLASCSTIKPEHAPTVAATLFQLACSAPRLAVGPP